MITTTHPLQIMWNYQTASPDRYNLLKEFARENRHNMTDAERVLWNELKSSALGVKFLRQHIIGDYIVDFVCRDNGLVIEVDGAYHAERQQQQADEEREDFLVRHGFHIVRFTNEEVFNELDWVLEEIEKRL